ncbi:NAD-dependent epimerase/dehydratase family protein [Cellulomonas sp. Leaf395]|uniref:NAD-dependent epimerase/dehydratase family protein n=1 Tax=Cellulomonas sp. Leaf395 TaxID=1736362 RepID=UPI00228681D6|nr:NAD-dependent epimerase/dehydratase family protein [Cellulomonas sp. Leaf395]
MTRVLVTGASGMLGRAVADRLVADGHEVRTLQRSPSHVAGAQDVAGSVTDPDVVRAAVRDREAVVHLAAQVTITGPFEQFEAVNVGGTRLLLEHAREAGVGRFVHVSSPSVAHHGRSLVGAGAGPADPHHARDSYARTKAAGELLALAAHDPDGLRVIVVRPHLVWGPGDAQLIGRIVERARAGRLPVLGDGAALIDTTYVDNAVDALVAALHADPRAYGEPYVVTNGEPRPVVELLAGICAASGVPMPRRHVPAALARGAGSLLDAAWRTFPMPGEPPLTRFVAEQLSTAHWFDQRRTREALGWTPRVGLDEGLSRLAGWTARQASAAAP